MDVAPVGFVDMEPHLGGPSLAALAALDVEIRLGLAHVPHGRTGGSHRGMGIVPPSLFAEPYRDYLEVIAAMTRDELLVLLSLGDEVLDPDEVDRAEFGEERAHPLSRRQMAWLEIAFGVYFPWKVYVELLPGGRWTDKSRAAGKAFTRDAMLHFARTVAFVRGLPMFTQIGSVKILGLAANDHGTVHRDTDGRGGAPAAEFLTLCPRGDKRFFLWNEATRTKTYAPSRAYWFSDAEYHGVEADPFFRYSLRIDGVFTDVFRARVQESLA